MMNLASCGLLHSICTDMAWAWRDYQFSSPLYNFMNHSVLFPLLYSVVSLLLLLYFVYRI